MVPAIRTRMNAPRLPRRRQGGHFLGLLLCTVGFVPGHEPDRGRTTRFAATLFSLFGPLFMWLCYAGVKALRGEHISLARKAHGCAVVPPSPVTVTVLFTVYRQPFVLSRRLQRQTDWSLLHFPVRS